jgi:phage shock protein E
MKTHPQRALFVTLCALSFCASATNEITQPTSVNPKINAAAFLTTAQDAMMHRENRRISEGEFLRMSIEPGTVVLDARSSEKFREMHIRGAINLSFPDITAESLARVIPGKTTRVLIYCNNNFANAEKAFPTKLPSASLNLSTYTALYDYGYRNVYELAPYVDVKATKLALVAAK